ncbi:MAG TPA: thiamine-phosphate kinase [Desulfosporosinus sp.]|nr:thiamine-phosphate kinase [Desulfosporosinus sp.]
MLLKDIGEEAIIKSITLSQEDNENILVPMGDDAAAYSTTSGAISLVSCHMMVEGSHFRRNWSTPFQIGVKAITKSVADIEAMGGTSKYLIVGLSLPPETDLSFVKELYEGFNYANSQCGINIIGGDISDCQGPITISLTIIGEVYPQYLVKRRGAKPGDYIVVTGKLGSAAAGLFLLMEKPLINDELASAEAIRQQLQMEPMHAKGRVIAQTGAVTAMTDISDGLIANLAKICSASECGANLRSSDIPIEKCCSIIAQNTNNDSIKWALFGGEDYELVATIRASRIELVKQTMADNGYEFYIIGQCEEKSGIRLDDQPVEILGFDHFGL